ncbi:acetylxylan esterase [Halobacillus seohaensis]|uniref:Acetylxylan esterase n=1 Tax=Halobacillus seohaensis TaxID=447421 RepID=A0ABW2EM09_9BACI
MFNDMSLTELKLYKGKSPRPEDFNDYWETALKELDQQSLEYELIPADFNNKLADCYHLYFTGVGGARIHCKLAQPKEVQEQGAGLVMFHGYKGNSGDWFDKIAYAAQGITVLAMDCRGQGGLSEDNLSVQGSTVRGHIIRGIDDPSEHNLYYRNVFLDTVHTARILMSMDHVDPNRVGAYGISQGGALAVVCSALEPKLKELVAVYPFLSDYKRAWEHNINASAYEEIVYYFRFFDPTHEKEEAFFNRLGYIDIQHFAERIKARVLWVTGLADEVCPPSTQFAAFNKIAAEKELKIYYEYGHERLPKLQDHVFQKMLQL